MLNPKGSYPHGLLPSICTTKISTCVAVTGLEPAACVSRFLANTALPLSYTASIELWSAFRYESHCRMTSSLLCVHSTLCLPLTQIRLSPRPSAMLRSRFASLCGSRYLFARQYSHGALSSGCVLIAGSRAVPFLSNIQALDW